jgi:hypothetical protein
MDLVACQILFLNIVFMVSKQFYAHASFFPMVTSNTSATNISSTQFTLPNSNLSITTLSSSTYLGWLNQIHPVLCGHELMGLVNGSEICPPKFIPDDQDDEGKEILNPEFSN